MQYTSFLQVIAYILLGDCDDAILLTFSTSQMH